MAGFDVVWLSGLDDGSAARGEGREEPIARPMKPAAAEPVTLAGAIAARVPDVAIGVIVDVAQGRHPQVLARDMLSLDVVTGGRAALLLWDSGASERSGAPDHSRSLQRVAEAAAICREMFAGSIVSGGHFFRTGSVRPALRPLDGTGPPVLVHLDGTLGPALDDGLVACVQSANALVTEGSTHHVRSTGAAVVAASAAAGSAPPPLLWRGSFDPLTGRPTPGPGASAGDLAAAGAAGLVLRPPAHGLPTGDEVAAFGRWWRDAHGSRPTTGGG
jgi:alkanesulfonate monooxygenase SsuD/methylene tetrahydromethanopterin reductase-like flavin-dependent oxidoreductase (luciferase family)